jgi:hypothetical protein
MTMTPGERLEALTDHLGTMAALLEETHADELENNHYGDAARECSYCRAIRAARQLVKGDQ